MIKKVLLSLAILALGSGGLVYWLQQDDELSAQSKALIDADYAFQSDLKQHPFFYVWGMDAKAEVEPETLGRLRYYEQWQQQGKPLSSANKTTPIQIQQLQKHPLSAEQKQVLDELNQVLKQTPEQSESFIRQHQSQFIATLATEQFAIQRYLHWLNSTDYVSLLIPVDGALPDYRTLHYLHLLHLVQVSLKPKEESKAALLQYISALQNMQGQKLSMVEKYILQNFMWQSLDLLNLKAQHASVYVLPLTQNVLSLRQSMHYEVSQSAQTFQSLAPPKGMSNWQYRLVYLPNRSLNQQVEDIEPYIALSELPYWDFLQQYERLQSEERSKYVLKNSVGNILAQVAVVDWRPYALRSRILDNKIRVFNAVQKQDALDELNKNREGYDYYQKEHQLCLKHPFPQENLPDHLAQDTCMPI
jgi:hypothetical protein